MKTILNDFLALLAIVALISSIRLYAKDKRASVEKFEKTYTIDKRRPEVAETIKLAQSKDDAADYAADTAIRDAVTPANLSNVDQETRQAWLDLVTRTDDELKATEALMLDAMTTAPGWPYHSAFLGRAVYARNARNLSPELVTKSDQWRLPLYEAAKAASVDDNLWQSLALGYIQTWPDLGRVHEKTATEVFKRAFEDPDFVTTTFSTAVTTIGKERAVKDLPDKAKPLWAAFEQLAKANDVLTAWPVHQRWDAAEWRERGEDLAAIEKQWKRGDVDEVRRLCFAWTSTHSVWDYDSAAAHKQANRLLELWPAGSESNWRNDPRADIVRYFLSGRTEDANGVVLARISDRIPGVPLPVVARAHVLAGDLTGADQIAKSADGFGSFEWTPYTLEVARHWVAKDKAKAREALGQLAPAAAEECDSIAIRQLVEKRSNAVSGTMDLSPRTAVGTPIPLCIDRQPAVVVSFSPLSPAIVDYGWDGARSGSTLLAGDAQWLKLPPPEGKGMRNFVTRRVSSVGDIPEIIIMQNP